MLIGEFIQKHQTTKDTVRFYVQEGLLTPVRRGQNYWYSAADESDFDQIKTLQQMGFSIAAIKKIREEHEKHCGTTEQWQFNLHLIDAELTEISVQEKQLADRRAGLTDLKEQLVALLDSASEGGETTI